MFITECQSVSITIALQAIAVPPPICILLTHTNVPSAVLEKPAPRDNVPVFPTLSLVPCPKHTGPSSSIKPAISNIVREYLLSNMPVDEKPMLNKFFLIGVFLTITFPSRQLRTLLYLTKIGSLRAYFHPNSLPET